MKLSRRNERKFNPEFLIFIGATNRPDLVDPALLRPGRFDRLVYLGIAQNKKEQIRILESLVRKFNLDPNFSMEKFAEKIPGGRLTGADLYAIASEANLNAITRKICQLENNSNIDGDSNVSKEVLVSMEDFEKALKEFEPSVSESDILYYEKLRDSITK